MKYIVLCFDDGFSDYKDNALPLLEKFHFKSTVALVSGYLDGSQLSMYKSVSIDDAKDMLKNGHEIAVHSDCHLKQTTFEDFMTCKKKFINWFGALNYGAVVPYSQHLDRQTIQKFSDNEFLYLTDSFFCPVKRSLREKALRIINHVFRRDNWSFIVTNHRYIYSLNDLKKQMPCFQRLPVTRQHDISLYKKLISAMKDEMCLTLVFHSITDIPSQCEWPEGSLSSESFESILKFLNNPKKYKILTQKELISLAKHNV